MKKTALLTALLALSQGSLRADVPLFINYQGKVYDSTGLPLGATGTASAPVAAPVNRKILFRFYDAVTGGNRLWTEEQTVTISVGEFSVLLGQGISATGTASGESRPAIDTVFTSGTVGRYLEITVDNGDNTITAADVAITPRQQITTTAFTFRARTADSIASSSDLAITPLSGAATNYGLGWYGTGRLFAGSAIDGPVLYGNAGGALGSNTNGTYLTALRWTAAGQVGIGSTSLAGAAATSKLVLQGDDATTPAQQLVIRGDADSNKRLLLGYNTTLNQATLTSYSAASTAANLILNSNGGNVGIGTTAPTAALSVAGAITATGAITANGTLTAGTLSTGGTLTASGAISGGSLSSSSTITATGTITGAAFTTTGTTTAGAFSTAGTVAATGAISSSNAVKAAGTSGHTFTSGDADGGLFSAGDGLVSLRTNGIDRLKINASGLVQINTTTTLGQLNIGSILATYYKYGGLNTNGGNSNNEQRTNNPLSINAEGTVFCTLVDISSDTRIKTSLHRTDSAQDLKTLMAINITDYQFKDTATNGNAPQKKVIAQQVEQVFPQAVSIRQGIIPDIYKDTVVKDHWVLLPTDLKVGEKVRMISTAGESLEEVLEVRPDAFRTALQPADDKAFIYGRQVPDFHSVDYDAIAMLNVSATQQLKNEQDAAVQALQAENKELRAQLAALTSAAAATKAQEASREARLTALENLLTRDAPASETIALKTARLAK